MTIHDKKKQKQDSSSIEWTPRGYSVLDRKKKLNETPTHNCLADDAWSSPHISKNFPRSARQASIVETLASTEAVPWNLERAENKKCQ